MPDIKVDDGCTIHAEIEGPERAPVLMLSNSLGTDLHMWDEQAGPLTRHFLLARYDRRRSGKSHPPTGPYTMERVGRDVLGRHRRVVTAAAPGDQDLAPALQDVDRDVRALRVGLRRRRRRGHAADERKEQRDHHAAHLQLKIVFICRPVKPVHSWYPIIDRIHTRP